MITALPEVARNVGTTRIVKGYALTSPVGRPDVDRESEKAFRDKIVWRALQVLTTKVEKQIVVDL